MLREKTWSEQATPHGSLTYFHLMPRDEDDALYV